MGIISLEARFPHGSPSEELFQQHLKQAYGRSDGYEFYAMGDTIAIELALTFAGAPDIYRMYIERVLMDLGGIVKGFPPELSQEIIFPAFIQIPWKNIPFRERMSLFLYDFNSIIKTTVFVNSPPEEDCFRAELTRRWGCDKPLVYYKRDVHNLTLVVHGEPAAYQYICAILHKHGGVSVWRGQKIPYIPTKFTDAPWSTFTSWQQWMIRVKLRYGRSV